MDDPDDMYTSLKLFFPIFIKWIRRNLRGKQEILGTLGMRISARPLKEVKRGTAPFLPVLPRSSHTVLSELTG